jgi:hypothetical protein
MQREEYPSRGLTFYALLVGVLLVVGLGGLGGVLGEVRTAVQSGATNLAAGPVQPVRLAGVTSAAPPQAPSNAPAASTGISCVNGRTPAGLHCEVTATGVEVYPPASASPPCKQGDGTIRLSYTDMQGQDQVTSGNPAWDAQRGLWAVTWAQGTLYFFSLPACP